MLPLPNFTLPLVNVSVCIYSAMHLDNEKLGESTTSLSHTLTKILTILRVNEHCFLGYYVHIFLFNDFTFIAVIFLIGGLFRL